MDFDVAEEFWRDFKQVEIVRFHFFAESDDQLDFQSAAATARAALQPYLNAADKLAGFLLDCRLFVDNLCEACRVAGLDLAN